MIRAAHPRPWPGYGPNTRTIMQFRVAGSGGSTAPVDDYDPALSDCAAAQPCRRPFAATQDAARRAGTGLPGCIWCECRHRYVFANLGHVLDLHPLRARPHR